MTLNATFTTTLTLWLVLGWSLLATDALSEATDPIVLPTLPVGYCPDSGLYLSAPLIIPAAHAAFQTGFDSKRWAGTFRKRALTQDASGISNGVGATLWDAADTLERGPSAAQRLIVTQDPRDQSLTPFALDHLPAAIQTLLNQSPQTGQPDHAGLTRLQYLRGDHSAERANAPPMRWRDRRLGDIVHSTPAFVSQTEHAPGDPGCRPAPGQTSHCPATVYIGANDGMLHAFDADSGRELFGYIPGMLLKKLPQLSDPDYQHQAFLDGSIAAERAQIGGQWKTVVSAGLGGGARGLFALDATFPDQLTEGKGVLFEFTENDDADIGNITAPPSIVKLHTTAGDERYFVLTASGINPPGAGNYLFLLALDKAPQTAWVRDHNYFKIRLGNANLVATPAHAKNPDGVTQLLYIGDLQGGLWRIDLSAGLDPSSLIAKQIFSARDQQFQPQPISATPVIAPAAEGAYLIFFGTGKYLDQRDTDPRRFQDNSFYAVRDHPHGPAGAATISREVLAKRTAISTNARGKSAYTIQGEQPSANSEPKQGWYLDFAQASLSGERSVSPALIADGQVFFNTLIPSTRHCDAGISGRSYALDIDTGKSKRDGALTGLKSVQGVIGSPVFIAGRTELGAASASGSRVEIQHYNLLNFHSMEGPTEFTTSSQTNVRVGRLSWREIPNWQDLNKHP